MTTMHISRFIVILTVLACLLFVILQGSAAALSGGGTGSSSTGGAGGAAAAAGGAQASGAGQTVYSGGTGQSQGVMGNFGISPGTGWAVSPGSSVGFSGAGDVTTGGFGQQQFSGGQIMGTGDTQRDVYSGYTPFQSGVQSSTYGYSNAQTSLYNLGYGAVVGQAPAGPAPGGGGSIQALGEAEPGGTCVSTCTESYTPYECSTLYCMEK